MCSSDLTITGLSITPATKNDGIGFFSEITGTVKNIGLIDTSVAVPTGSYAHNIGALAGKVSSGGKVLNSFATGNISVPNGSMVGGLVGNNNGSIIDSFFDGSVSGISYVGGLVGYNDSGAISGSSAKGNVKGEITQEIARLIAQDVVNSISASQIGRAHV